MSDSTAPASTAFAPLAVDLPVGAGLLREEPCPPVTSPAVHHFADTGEAYDETQCSDAFRDGDVLVIASEGVVGFLNRAWPAALTAERGQLHSLTEPVGETDGGRYTESARVAAEQARTLGLDLLPEHSTAASATAPADHPALAHVQRQPFASPLVTAARAFGDLVAETDRCHAAITVRRFESTGDLRAAADRDEMGDDDVFVVETEGIVGLVVATLPTAMTEQRGALPHLPRPGREFADGSYIDSGVVAEREARALGFPLRDDRA